VRVTKIAKLESILKGLTRTGLIRESREFRVLDQDAAARRSVRERFVHGRRAMGHIERHDRRFPDKGAASLDAGGVCEGDHAR